MYIVSPLELVRRFYVKYVHEKVKLRKKLILTFVLLSSLTVYLTQAELEARSGYDEPSWAGTVFLLIIIDKFGFH